MIYADSKLIYKCCFEPYLYDICCFKTYLYDVRCLKPYIYIYIYIYGSYIYMLIQSIFI